MCKKKHNISFFFPAFNDAGTVEKLAVAAIEVLENVADKYEVIIVNDGSFDNTGNVADEVAEKYEHIVVRHHLYNIGYGAALKTGFYTAKYELIFYTDGDMQYDPKELEKMLPLLNKADIVAGYKIKRADSRRRILSAWFYNQIIKIFLGVKVKDVDAAAKLFKREVIDNMQLISNGGFICAELFAKAKKQGYKITQVPVKHYPRTYGSSSAFDFFFILRSILELIELWWNITLREKVFRLRQKFWSGIYGKKISDTRRKTG